MKRGAGTAGRHDAAVDVRRAKARRMAVIWGVHSLEVSEIQAMTEMVARAVRAAQHEGFAKTGDEVVVTAGVPFRTLGSTNALRVAVVRLGRRRLGCRKQASSCGTDDDLRLPINSVVQPSCFCEDRSRLGFRRN